MNPPRSHPRMTAIPVEDAVGSVLCHDITVIRPGVVKDRAFRKGHVVRPEDISVLLDLGKEHLYVFSPEAGFLHEEDAALRLATASRGDNLDLSDVREGRINFIATRDGLLSVNVPLLTALNSLGDITFATMHSYRPVRAGERVAGVRVVPLMVEERIVSEAERLCRESRVPLIQVRGFQPARVGVIITGSEIFHGRIEDKFAPVLREKFSALGSTILREVMTSDDVELTKNAIHQFLADDADMIVLTGGMSVDPDDLTPTSIRAAGAEVVTYGAPVFPGAMFLLAHIVHNGRSVPVMGLPGCVMYHRASIFDLVVPRILAGFSVTREDIAALGHGGFCSNCAECRYPGCGFGC